MNGIQEVMMLGDAQNVNHTIGIVKKCSKCEEIKPICEFAKRKSMKDGYRSECKTCRSRYNQEWYALNKEKQKEYQRKWRYDNQEKAKKASKMWHQNNKERSRELSKAWSEKNPEKAKECQKKGQLNYRARHKQELAKKRIEQYAADPEKFLNKQKKWRQKNLEHARALARKASQKIRDTTRGTLNDRISAGIRQSLKGSKKGLKWESLVGYTLNDLKKHIESKFKSGMTWSNIGQWHIDHKIPKSVFNFSDPDHIDFKKCWSLKNLQPMWAKDNLKKHNKLEKHFQPSLAI